MAKAFKKTRERARIRQVMDLGKEYAQDMRIVNYQPGNTLNAIKELREITSGVWDQHNTDEEIREQLLRD